MEQSGRIDKRATHVGLFHLGKALGTPSSDYE